MKKQKGLKKSKQQAADKIQDRAYRIWESKGKPTNTAIEDWIQAEQELQSN
ncbi:MAG: DUF2934 domain-containing protein [Candidatus Omnitrophica bacterium]|nr:DUF2934 domain-containing protein [Candidatus Omnitrophota bacterium]